MALDFTRICRICLEDYEQTSDIFTTIYYKNNTSYCDMLTVCTNIKPYQGDGFPRLICKECSKQLKRTYSFYTKCEKSDHRLRKFLENELGTEIKPLRISNIFCTETNQTVQNDTFCDIKQEQVTPVNSSKEFEVKIVKIESIANEDDHALWDAGDIDNDVLKDVEVKKSESILGDDSLNFDWDAEDDNVLDVIKAQKSESIVNEDDHSLWDAGDNDVLKAVEVKKSESILGDDNLNDDWDAEDDNVLDVIKAQKSDIHHIKDGKKKRGRKRKVILDGEAQVPESKLPHQCDVCGKFLSTKSNLKAHKLCHTDLRPYACSDCPATFRGHSALFQHKKIHSGETPYHCEYCPKQFSRRTGLVNHIRMHTGEKHYSCEICSKTFVQSAQLSTHMKRHKGEKPYLCQVCGKGFPIKAELHVHQRVHNGEKPYACHLCTKTFATSGNLSIHVRIHNKEVRYKCKECHRGFVTCSSYNVHLKRHKGQRDYICECGKTFYTSSALKQHGVVHTGEKKYQCKICNRKFTQTSHLSRHFKKVHAKPDAPVPPSNYYKLVLTDKTMSDDSVLSGKLFAKNDEIGKIQSNVKLGTVKHNLNILVSNFNGGIKSESS